MKNNKIAIKALLFFLVSTIVGMGFYYYIESSNEKKIVQYIESDATFYTIPNIMLPDGKLAKNPNQEDNTIIAQLEDFSKSTININSGTTSQNNNGNFSFIVKKQVPVSSGSGGGNSSNFIAAIGLHGNQSASNLYQNSEGMLGGNSNSTLFAPRKDNGIILIDPMEDPIEENRIPVGDGFYFLLLLAVLYQQKRKR